jgi:hypothetical protein
VRAAIVAAHGIALSACAAPPEAPTELASLSRYLFREWGADDLRAQEAGIANLRAQLGGIDLGGERAGRSYLVDDLEEGDVAAIDRPDRPLANCLPVAIGGLSRHPIAAHARLLVEPDQTAPEPGAVSYLRQFLDPTDPACFIDRTCEALLTRNEVHRENALMSVHFVLWKDFRWVDDGDGAAIFARAWFDQSWPGDQANTALLQSYTVDLWLSSPDGLVWRFQTNWAESDLGVEVDDEIVSNVLAGGIDSGFGEADDAIDALLAE